MFFWIESQPTGLIAAIVLTICYLSAGLIFIGRGLLANRRIAIELKTLTPVILTPLAVVAGLLIAFLASRVWGNLERANLYVAQEASGINETVLLADQLPAETRDAVRTAIRGYLKFLESDDWPMMVQNRASLAGSPAGLTDALRAIVACNAVTAGQQAAQMRAIVALEQVLEARRQRILLSHVVIAPIQWVVVFLLAGLILVTLAIVHLDKPVPAACALFILSTAFAVCFILLLVNDRPYSEGGHTVEPQALRQLHVELAPAMTTAPVPA